MTAIQLDLFAEPLSAPVVTERVDTLVDRLVWSGMVPNDFLLTLNHALGVPAMDLPSRLFQWPVEFVNGKDRPDGMSVLLLNHPDLAGLPFLDEIEQRAGVRPHWEAEDRFGRDRGHRHRYFHAMDLLTDLHWLDLLRTRNFTDREGIISGLNYRAQYGGLSIPNARSVLSEISSPEPKERSAAVLNGPSCKIATALQGEFVGFAVGSSHEDCVWATIHGLEDGFFKRDASGYLRFSKAFLEQKRAAA